jgi:hypothetical protein
VSVEASFKDIITHLRTTRRKDRLYAYFLDRVKGARVAGAPMVELPPSMQAILGEGQEGPEARKLTRRALKITELDPGVVVSGKAEMGVEILPPRRL